MLKQPMYSIFDLKAQTFGFPFTAPTDGSAIRLFQNETNRADDTNLLYKHPADFILFKVGTFDIASGELTSFQPTPERLVNGTEVQAPSE